MPQQFRYDAELFWTTTLVFAILGLIGCLVPCVLRNKQHNSTIYVTVIGSTLCFWLFWFCTYAMQINPIIAPAIE